MKCLCCGCNLMVNREGKNVCTLADCGLHGVQLSSDQLNSSPAYRVAEALRAASVPPGASEPDTTGVWLLEKASDLDGKED